MSKLCQLGLHKWKQVRTYSAVGVSTVVWPFIATRDHYPWHGVERCSRCAKRVANRKDAYDISVRVGAVVFCGWIAAAMVPVLIIACKILWECFIDLWRIALQ